MINLLKQNNIKLIPLQISQSVISEILKGDFSNEYA